MKFRLFLAVSVILSGTTAHAVAARPKLPPKYDKWLKQEVVYIITDEERKAFLELKNDAERDKFIQNFWDVRNPLRGTDRNPYKEEIDQRIAYANQHFGRMTNTPGWMTDMGRAYITLGKPTSMHEFIGYGQIYPLALWSYANNTGDPSLPPFFNVLFFQPEGIEEYRFYHPYADGPLKLVRGSNFNTNADVYRALLPLGGDVANAAFTFLPDDPVDTQSYQPDLTGDMLVAKIQNLANDSFNLRKLREMRALRERVSSYFLVSQARPVRIDSFVLPDPSGQYWLDYAVAIDREELGVPAKNGDDLNLRIDYHLTTTAGALIVEDSEQRAYAAFDHGPSGAVFQPFQVANRLPIQPGDYRLEVDVVNQQTGKSFRGVVPVLVKPPEDLALRGPLLAGEVDKVERPDSFTPFEYYGVQFYPSAEGVFLTRNSLTVLYDLEEPPTGPSGCVVDYMLASTIDRSSRKMLSDTIAAADFHNGRLLKSKTIPLTGLDSGEYHFVLTLRRVAGGPALASANLFVKLVNDQPAPVLYMSANSRNLGRGGVASYIRALEASSQGDDKQAALYMQRALDQNPANTFAGEFLVQLYFRQRNYAGVAELYHKLGLSPFKTSSQSLAQIGLSCWKAGQPAEARKVLAAARSSFPNDPILKTATRAVNGAR